MAISKFSSSRFAPRAVIGASLLALTAVPIAAQTDPVAVAVSAEFAAFAPSGDRIQHTIDYSVWDEAMRYIVFPMGKSLRETAGLAQPGMGSRRIYGHTSRFRLEGNRVMFSFFDEALKQSVSDYRAELEQIPNSVAINRMPRNEQLAYWINLHNVALIDQIAKEWPVRQPSTIELDGVPLDKAKFITVGGVKMSPHDIRTQIVYPNWRDPRVIYGFWRGDIGGPSIQRAAFTSENVDRLLDRGAKDFVNSLRGTQKRDDRLQVSTIYEEARPFFFKDWQNDLRAHIAAHAETEVSTILSQTGAVEAVIYEADIADMAGGVREPSYSNVTSDGSPVSFRIPQGMARLLAEQERKMEKIIREGRTGTVIFSNIRLPGEGENDGEVE